MRAIGSDRSVPVRSAVAALAAAATLASGAAAQISLDVETGAALSGYNDVGIPGDGGTRFSLTDDLESETTSYLRLRLGYQRGRSHVSVLYAPLRIHAEGSLDRDLRYTDVTFPAATPLDATYVFNSYRLTYRYDVYRSPALALGLGLTAKVRDADITVTSDTQERAKTNVGFVPLINFDATWRWTDRAGLRLAGDALAAPQGRAEDVMIAAWVAPSPRLEIRAGYRLLEGGADNDEVYTFALIHYLLVGISVRP